MKIRISIHPRRVQSQYDFSKLDAAILDAVGNHTGARAAAIATACKTLLAEAAAGVQREPMRVLESRMQKLRAAGKLELQGSYWYPIAKPRAAAEEQAP
jgi:hypothetical protein